MITFADGQKPPVLKALEERKIPSQRSFRFNNSALYAESGHPADCSDQGYNAIDKDAFNKMFWKMGMTNFKEFFSELWKVEPKSLTLTQEVLKERENLEASVQGLEERVRMTLMKIGELEKEQHILEKYQANVEANKNFRYEIKVPKFHQIELEGGKFVTNCLKCKSTCHYPCRIPQDKDKDRCRAMKSGKCTVCDNNCAWNVHVNNSYRIEVTWLTETRTFDNLKQRYADALKQKGQKETVSKFML